MIDIRHGRRMRSNRTCGRLETLLTEVVISVAGTLERVALAIRAGSLPFKRRDERMTLAGRVEVGVVSNLLLLLKGSAVEVVDVE